MALLEEFIEFRVFSSYYIFSEVLYAQKKIGEDKRPPQYLIHYEIQIPHPKNLPMKSLTLI